MKKVTNLQLLILLLVLCTSFLSAQNTWNGGGDGTSWEDPLNWTVGIPELADRVIIDAGNTVIISSAAEAESVDNSGDLTIQPNHSLTIIGASVFDGISNQGTVINKGTINPENAQQLCLPLNAANTHIGNHGGCFFGLCSPGSSSAGYSNNDNEVVKTPSGAEESMFNISLEDHRFANGIYYVSVFNNGENITKRLVVQK